MFEKLSRTTVALTLALVICASARAETHRLDLDGCLNTAYRNNQTLRQMEERIRSAGYKIEEARSGFYPQLSLSSSYTRLGSVLKYEIEGMSFKLGSVDNYSLGLSLQQPLFTWGRIKSGYEISKYGLSLSREEYRQAQQEIKFNVTNLFYNLLLAGELIKIREGSIARTEDHLKTVQERYDKGYASEFDLLRVKVELANAKPPLVQAKNLYKLALDNLKNLLGIDLADSVRLDGSLEFAPIQAEQSRAEELAFENRSELKLIGEQNKIGMKALALAQAGNKPSLFGTANYQYAKPYYGQDVWKTDWNFTLALSLPIFDGFLTRSKVRSARSDLRLLEISESQIKDGIRLEISQAISDLNLARENILSQEENIKQARESLRIANVQYQKGMLTNLELMDTEFALTVAETNYLQALSDYSIAKAKYERAIGTD